MSDKRTIAILIMAAGQSLRMKGIKQLLPWKGSNLLLSTLNTLLEVQKNHIYLVLGANAEEIVEKAKLESQPVKIIKNKAWKNGLGSSISCGVAAIIAQNKDIAGVLVCLADQPLFTCSYYTEMLRVFNADNAAITATAYHNKAGVPAIFNIDIAKELTTLRADYGAKHLMVKYKKETIVLDAGDLITDIDTPDVYAVLYKRHHSKE